MNTLVLLKFDGVVNPARTPDTVDAMRATDGTWAPDSWRSATVRTRLGSLLVVWSRAMVAELTKLALEPGLQVWWAATWELDIQKAAKRTGLPRWPVLPDELEPWSAKQSGPYWMAAYAEAELATNSWDRVVWIDDDIPAWERRHDGPPEWSRDPRLMKVCPDRSVGLTPTHLEEVRAWLESR